MTRAFIVDDEDHNRMLLKTMLAKHCTNIDVIGETDNADDAFAMISDLNPKLIFLDVKMPTKNGFDLLKMFNEINFEVIFITAHNEFAINAFELNAIGYILKPIDYTLLSKTVAKAELLINSNLVKHSVSNFVKTLNADNSVITKISVHHHGKVIFINFEDIISIQTNNGYCEISAIGDQKYYAAKELKMYENVFKDYSHLLRVNKSCIINLRHIKSYSKQEPCFIELTNGQSVEVPRRKKGEILNKITSV